MKYYAAQKLADEYRFVEVEGKPVKLKGFEDFEFFSYKLKKVYQIIEAQTGRKIESSPWLKEARASALATLERIGKEILKQGIEDLIKTHGLSPRYKGEL